jgi:hypothetical protein
MRQQIQLPSCAIEARDKPAASLVTQVTAVELVQATPLITTIEEKQHQ